MSDGFEAWLKQPTTIHALGVLAGAGIGFGVFYLTGSIEGGIGAASAAYAAVHGAMPDNTTETTALKKLLKDTLEATAEHRFKQEAPILMADIEKVVAARGAETVAAAAGVAAAATETVPVLTTIEPPLSKPKPSIVPKTKPAAKL
jgi:hypothetical protein